MALISCSYYSPALSGKNDFYLVIPNDLPPMMTAMTAKTPAFQRPMKTIVLLHGFSGCSRDWLNGSSIQDLCSQYNVAAVMPSCRNSFYLDRPASGENFSEFVGEELIGYCRKVFGLSDRREDTFICGYSMGGYGAMRTGLKYSHNYSKLAAFSSGFIYREVSQMTPGHGNFAAGYDYYAATFGTPATVMERDVNPEVLVKEKLAAGEKLPDIFMACGSEDMLLPLNKAFDAFLTEQGVKHEAYFTPGEHNFRFWNPYLEKALLWMLDE